MTTNTADPSGPKARPLTKKTLAEAFARRLGLAGAAELDVPQAAFIDQVHAHCAADELAEIHHDDLAALMERFWRFADKVPAGEGKAHLIAAKDAEGKPLRRDVLEVVQPDSPFLVDSIMGALVDEGASVLAMFHPLLPITRDKRGARAKTGETRRESMIHVQMEPLGEDRRGDVLAAVQDALADVHAAVEDFPQMLALLSRTVIELETSGPQSGDLAEQLAFLRWLHAEHFVFVGARVYAYAPAEGGGYAPDQPMSPEENLGILRDQTRSILRSTHEPGVLASARQPSRSDSPLVVAKANARSRVHRRAHLDYIGVKRYDAEGRACGEVRFVGLFTSEAYDQPALTVPLVRRKIDHVIARSGAAPESHNARRLHNILETYPRDELFQIAEGELGAIALKILHLYDRPRLRLFARRDPLDRFVSVLLFLPRDRYNSAVAERAGRIVADAWSGRVSAAYPSFSDAPLARVHYIIGLDRAPPREPVIRDLERRILEAIRTWEDRFEARVRETALSAASASAIIGRYRGAFPAGYRDLFSADDALADIAMAESLDGATPVRVRAYRAPSDIPDGFRLKLYRRGGQAALSDILPVLERMGLRALVEHGFPLRGADDRLETWVHEIVLHDPQGSDGAFEEIKAPFEAAFTAVWEGRTENDGFNRLVLELGIPWREAALIRTLARYRQQTGLDPSQAVQEAALSAYPGIARLILDMFRTKFDTAVKAPVPQRAEQAEAIFGQIVEALQAVASLDDDRVLRRLALLVRAATRTNYYQLGPDGQPKAYISVKIASQTLDDLPLPKPHREIFVWSPMVEGVHLRFGPVARGGLRWSDRRDDFRTEVLGLAKAQQVKNAVIVPVGAKGGFYPKQLPKVTGKGAAAPDQTRAAAIEAYKTFLYGLLDITDNLDANGKVVPPVGVIRHEDDDPYLVVAADKGTASFSDIANGVAESYGFWLGDAFASGGSAGYDHKAMGITARGAWEAVKRHFREMGKDIQNEPFTAIGVGDMSGDVFGNGMLLSKKTRLLAAFDHRHIFLDPDPDAAVSFKERQRLFKLPRSSWADYDAKLISKGGGVFPRSAKSIVLTPEARAMLEVTDEALTPADLIRAVLRAPAELLYLGGIGTYVKAPAESHADVGDKATDPVRIDATELRVRVVGEGANLGFTQAGRIAFALAGGRINTDAIDNSAGVDSSDHEVNIKILTGAAERRKRLTRAARDPLLASMTADVAAHVLQDNYDQTLALSLLEATAANDLDSHARFMADLVAEGRLDRRVEGLPGPAALAELAKLGRGLSRPELAVLLAYGKLELSAQIVASAAPDDPYFEHILAAYFPPALGKYTAEMQAHPLRREIIATVLANDIVDLAGPTFPPRLEAAARGDTRALVTAFTAAREIYGVDDLLQRIDALDAKIPAAAQILLYRQVTVMLRRQVFWLVRQSVRPDTRVQSLIDAYRPAAAALRKAGGELFSPFERAAAGARAADYVAAGAPADLALEVGELGAMFAASDMADIARMAGWPVLTVARVYHTLGAAFGFDRLRNGAGQLFGGDAFQRRAVRRLIEDLLLGQAAITTSLTREAAKPPGGADGVGKAVAAWAARRAVAAENANATLRDIEAADGGWTFAKLTIAAGALRELADTAAG